MKDEARVSVVVPLFNEEPNVRPLVNAVRDALSGVARWELLLVDDGSTDGTVRVADEEAARDARVRALPLARNFGQTAAMQAGFDHARGEIVVSMDGDLQNDPRDIPELVEKIRDGYDLVAGYRADRQDRLLTRKVPSWIANWIIQRVTGVPIRDNGCSLKAYRKELLERMNLYSDLHRFIPSIAAATSAARIAEVRVRHHPRRRGESKYGLSRVGKVAADIVTVGMIRSFRERPLVMFGGSAFATAGAGLLMGGFSLVSYVAARVPEGQLVLPTVMLLLLSASGYLLLLGLVAEFALRHQRRHRGGQLPIIREHGW